MSRSTLFGFAIRGLSVVLIAAAAASAVVGLGWLDQRDDGITAPILIRQQALAEAKKHNKRLLLWFYADYGEYCVMMDHFHADPRVAAILDKYFVVEKVDIARDFGGEHVYYDLGPYRGIPAFSLLDGGGTVLADSGEDQETNLGFPDASQLDAYAAVMKKACPEITEQELQILREKIIEIRALHPAEAATNETQEPAP